jgi:hypothetical protein
VHAHRGLCEDLTVADRQRASLAAGDHRHARAPAGQPLERGAHFPIRRWIRGIGTKRFGNDREIDAHRELLGVRIRALGVEHARDARFARGRNRPGRGVEILTVHEQHARAADRVVRELRGCEPEPRIAMAQHGALAALVDEHERAARGRVGDAAHAREVDAGLAQRCERELGLRVVADRAEEPAGEPQAHRREHRGGDLPAWSHHDRALERELLASAWPARQRRDAIERDLPEAYHVDRAVSRGAPERRTGSRRAQ